MVPHDPGSRQALLPQAARLPPEPVADQGLALVGQAAGVRAAGGAQRSVRGQRSEVNIGFNFKHIS